MLWIMRRTINVFSRNIAVFQKMKIEILSIMTEEGINFEESVTAVEARQLFKNWIAVNMEPEIVTLAKRKTTKFYLPHSTILNYNQLNFSEV